MRKKCKERLKVELNLLLFQSLCQSSLYKKMEGFAQKFEMSGVKVNNKGQKKIWDGRIIEI